MQLTVPNEKIAISKPINFYHPSDIFIYSKLELSKLWSSL